MTALSRSAPSLLRRVVLRLSLTTAVAIVAAYGWLWLRFETTTGNLRDASLIENARTLVQVIADLPPGAPLALTGALESAYRTAGDAYGFAIRDRRTGEILLAGGAPVGPVPVPLEEDEDGSLYVYDPDGPGPICWFGDAYPFERDGRALVVQVVRLGSDYQELLETVLADFFEDGGWMAGPFLLLLLLVSILTLRTTLRPLMLLSEQAEGIGPATADVRLPLTDVPREVLPLVRAVNLALARLEQGIHRQREFTADAAHELRTPLAVLTAHIDTLPDPAVAAALRKDLAAMTHLVEQLLRVSRAEALVVGEADQTDLCALAEEVAVWLGPTAIRARRSLEVIAPPGPVRVQGQEDALFHAIRNLVDNALRHTREGTTVSITVVAATATAGAQVAVRDFGPGVPDAQRDAIFRRFWRGDHSTVGSGLGLSIVRRTMEAHGGTVWVQDADGGGACFVLSFPPLPDVPAV